MLSEAIGYLGLVGTIIFTMVLIADSIITDNETSSDGTDRMGEIFKMGLTVLIPFYLIWLGVTIGLYLFQ